MKRQKAAVGLLLACSLGFIRCPALAVDDTGADSRNTPPVAENMELETYRGVSVGGQLRAYDADGDTITFQLETEPMKGTVELSADGHFIYTPEESRRGRDYFGFRAVDSEGNASQEGTVIIRLLRQKAAVTYADMDGHSAEYAAVLLTKAGVFTAEAVGGDHLFYPEEDVTRGEFLTMCMTAADCDILKGVRSTGFQDDEAIASWLKPYVSTALLRGYIRGSATETGAVFEPDEPVSLQDACEMLNSVLGVTDVVSAAAYVNADPAESSWAQAAANLTACGVMPDRWDDWEENLSRAQAAQMLQKAMNLLDAR